MEKQTKKIFHFRPLFYCFLILTLAISCAKFLFADNITYIILTCSVFLALVVFLLARKKIAYFFVLFAVFAFGIGWYFLGMSIATGKEYDGQCEIVARVSDNFYYSNYETSCRTILKDVKINNKKAKNIEATIYFQDKEEIKAGDVISFKAEVLQINPFELGEFQSYNYRNNISYICEVSTNQISILKNKLTVDEKIRNKIKSKLSGMKNGAIAYAVLLGDKSGVSEKTNDMFVSAGIIHLLAVSGLHISFLIALLGFVLKKCRVKGWINLLVCFAFVSFYAFLCGFSPSVIRAGIMGLVLSMASVFGKRYDSLNSLGLAGILILLFKPLFALDLGFLMSFFCVFSIFSIYPVFTKFFEKFLPKKVAAGVALSLSAQIGVLPFSLKITPSINFLSVFANLLIVPIFSFIYPLLFVSTLLVLVLPFMSFLLRVCDFGLDVVSRLAYFFGQTHAIASIEAPSILIVAAAFLIVLMLSKFCMANAKTKLLFCSFIVCFCCGSIFLPQVGQIPQSSVSLANEYSNDVVLLTNKSGKSVIIDVGSKDFTKDLLRQSSGEKLSAVFVLQSSNVKIDAVRQMNCERIIRTGSGEGYEEEMLVGLDEVGSVSGFTFCFRSDQGKVVGLEVNFDGLKIFIVRQRYTTAENFKNIGTEKFDLVLLGKKDEYAPSFIESCNFAGYYQKSGFISSFEQDGNVKLLFKNEKIIRRYLD